MAVITLTSATGAPGVTTAALGLALTWPRDVLLVDRSTRGAPERGEIVVFDGRG